MRACAGILGLGIGLLSECDPYMSLPVRLRGGAGCVSPIRGWRVCVCVNVWVKGISVSEEMFGMDLIAYSFPNCAELTNTPFI